MTLSRRQDAFWRVLAIVFTVLGVLPLAFFVMLAFRGVFLALAVVVLLLVGSTMRLLRL
jgi:hypothetical protein